MVRRRHGFSRIETYRIAPDEVNTMRAVLHPPNDIVSLGPHDDFDLVGAPGRGEVGLQPSGVSHSSVWIIHKADQGRSIRPGGIVGGIGRDLFGEVPGRQSGAGLFDDHNGFLPIQEVAGSARAVRIGGSPLLRANLIELQSEERIEQILQIILVVDFERRAIFFS